MLILEVNTSVKNVRVIKSLPLKLANGQPVFGNFQCDLLSDSLPLVILVIRYAKKVILLMLSVS